jgi:hypothetical protein
VTEIGKYKDIILTVSVPERTIMRVMALKIKNRKEEEETRNNTRRRGGRE